jgi:hypothetical protein
MLKNCNCGATLPEDARFCHRCGKPQWAEDIAAFEPIAEARASAVPPPVPAGAGSPLTFSNPLALRTSLLVASITAVLEIIPFAILIAPLLGGFASVSLYQRRSGQSLTTGAAAKLGWITAIINAVLFTMWMILNFALQGTPLFDLLRESIKKQVATPAQQEALKMLSDPWVLGVAFVFGWLMLLVITSLMFMAGGALGAKFSKQRTS